MAAPELQEEGQNSPKGWAAAARNYRWLQYTKKMLTAFCPSQHHAESHKMDLLRTAPSPLTLPPKAAMSTPFWKSVLAPNLEPRFHEFHLFLTCLRFGAPNFGQVLEPVLGGKN